MTVTANRTPVDRANSRNAFLAGFFAWTFDAFDFFILTYVLVQVARDFHRPISDLAFTLTASLIMRPVGAFFFGLMAAAAIDASPLLIAHALVIYFLPRSLRALRGQRAEGAP